MPTLLEQFEETGKEVYQITKSEWVNIKNNHMTNWYTQMGITDITERLERDTIESECFHKEAVTGALNQNIFVSDIVLQDYKGLKEQLEEKKRQKESIPLFTQNDYNNICVGDKITVNNHYKMTVYRKEENKIICRVYKKKRQGIDLYINERYNIKMGWNKED